MAETIDRFVDVIGDQARVRRLEPFGLEIDFDLSRPLDETNAEAFRELFYRETLLLFRNQTLAMDEQTRVMEYVGPIVPDWGKGYLSPRDNVLGTDKLDYHSDLSWAPMPLDAISLLAIDLDEEGTSWTGFVSGLRAFQTLPPNLQRRIADIELTFVQTNANKSLLSYDIAPNAYKLTRPCVIKHRITGESIIYAIESAIARVEGLERGESAALLNEIFGYIYSPENEMRHIWRQGDFLLWDNMALQHCRPSLDSRFRRHMQRIGAGRKSLREQAPDYCLTPVYGEE